MIKKRTENGIVYTPPKLAKRLALETKAICDELGFAPTQVIDPCCGKGALLAAGIEAWGMRPSQATGYDIDDEGVKECAAKGFSTSHVDIFNFTQPVHANAVALLNPPYVGCSNLKRIVGEERFKWLKKHYAATGAGSCDLAGYVLRHVLEVMRPPIMGVVATNTIFQGGTRRVGTHWAVRNGYLIANVSQPMPWGKDAVVTVQTFVVVDARRFGLPSLDLL